MADKAPEKKTDGQISDDQLQDVVGGNKIQKTRLEQLDTHDSSKSVDNVQEARLDGLDNRDSSK